MLADLLIVSIDLLYLLVIIFEYFPPRPTTLSLHHHNQVPFELKDPTEDHSVPVRVVYQ